MPLLPATIRLSHPGKDALIAALTARLALADARIAALEARLNELTRPPKTPGNSSKPPSQGQKQDLPAPATDRPAGKSRPGAGRTLHPHPDRTIRPDVTQVRRSGGRCTCCGERVSARAHAGLEQGSPFGHSIAAMVVYLHYAHAIGMERLALLMNELFAADQRGRGGQYVG